MEAVREAEMVLKVLSIVALFGATGAAWAAREGWRLGWGLGFSAWMTAFTAVFCGLSYIAAFY